MTFRIPKITFWRVVLVVLWTFGLVAAIQRFYFGLGTVTNLSDDFPWGIWIGFDILVGVGLAAGGFAITATVYIFNLKDFKPISKPTVLTAFLGYLLVIGALMFDLGKPWNVWHPIIMWNPHSVMFEVGWCVMLYTTVLLLEFSPLVFERLRMQKPLRIIRSITVPLVILGVLLSTLHQSSLGTLYVIVPDKLHPLWYSGFLPVFFFVSAIAGGLAMVIFESFLSARAFGKEIESSLLIRLSRAIVVILFLWLAMRFFDLLARDALAYMFEGSMESWFFLGEIIIGAIVPMALFLTRRVRETTGGLFLASVLVLFGFITNRLNVAVTGMVGSAGYIPSWQEIVITASIVALGLVIFRLVARHTPVFESQVTEPSAAKPPLVAAGRSGKLAMGVLFALLIFIMTGLGYTLANKRVDEKQIVGSPKLIPAESGLEYPEPIVFQPSEDSPGKVTFNHETHVDPYEPGCGKCHTEMFAIRPEQAGVTVNKGDGEMILHEKCGSCHDGENAFSIDDGCEFCHQLPE